MSEEIGNTHEIRGEVHVEWQIPEFLSLSGKYYHSAVFCTFDSLWYLGIYPNGTMANPDHVEFRAFPGEKVRKENKDSQTDADERYTDFEYNTLQKLQKDFQNLFKSGEDCDVTIKVQSKEFPAHRSILRSRSPVFKSMFSHETQENLSGVVVIDDCDPETFPDFLNYLYSGSTKHITEKNVCHLFTASDKYQVKELKEGCAKFMKSHLSVETFCDFMTVSLMHSAQELIDSATKFFCSNAEEIVKTVKWQIFLKENLTVGNELFLNFIESKK